MKAYEELLETMQERYRELTGFEADRASDIGIRLKVLAMGLAELYEEAEELRVQAFPQTSGGRYLELHAATRGLSRKPARYAGGTLRFTRESPAPGDIVVEAGALCATRAEEPVYVETVESGVLPAGERSLELPARAVEPGSGGNVAAGAVCLLVGGAPGITGVGNPASFEGGVDGESDGELRSRLLMSYENISNSTNPAYYYDLAMGDEGVASANILPRSRGRGTVDVVVAGYSQGDEGEIVARLGQLLEKEKEINVDVRVLAAVRDATDVTAEIQPAQGGDFGAVEAACRRTLTQILDGMEVGQPLLLADLCSRLFAVEGVYNCRLLAPAGDIATGQDHVVRCGEITLGRMNGPEQSGGGR